MNRLLIYIICIAAALPCQAQRPLYERSDSTAIASLLQSSRQQPEGVCLPLFFARQLIGRPYVAHTLEVSDNERLVVNTRQLDCTTLVETAVALSLCAARRQYTFADYCAMLTALRYRQGRLDGYPSRLHYFSDWAIDNAAMGFINEIQQKGAPFTAVQTLDINYMSTHPKAYKALRQHPQMVSTIRQQEAALTGRKYRYIPKQAVDNSPALRQAIHDGDIIAITCSKPGLDIAHVGIAAWHDDGLHLLNASQLHKKVVEEPMTLGEYLKKHPSHTGIRVMRITGEPRQ